MISTGIRHARRTWLAPESLAIDLFDERSMRGQITSRLLREPAYLFERLLRGMGRAVAGPRRLEIRLEAHPVQHVLIAEMGKRLVIGDKVQAAWRRVPPLGQQGFQRVRNRFGSSVITPEILRAPTQAVVHLQEIDDVSAAIAHEVIESPT